MKHCNNLLEPLKNIKEIQEKEREAWMDAMDKIERIAFGQSWKKCRPDVFKFMINCLDKDSCFLRIILFVM